MNEKFTNTTEHDDDVVVNKLIQVAEQTHANGQFATELEQKLRSAHQPKTGWFTIFTQISPTLGWVALMALLIIVLSWSIRSLIPAPQPAAENTPSSPSIATPVPNDDIQNNTTPAPEGEGIDFRGAKLYMNAPLPDSPGQARVYQAIESQPATVEYTQSLAQQFGITGDVYLTIGQNPNTPAYMVTDGMQQLIVYGENNYSYVADMVTNSRTYNGAENENAEAIIREFLQSHGFNTNVKFIDSGVSGGYTLQQLTPDGMPIEYEYNAQPSVRITLKENGEVLSMTVILANYDPNGVGSFGIISADEAYQKILNDESSAGKLETAYGGAQTDENYVPPQIWYHDYSDNETHTIYGNISANQSADGSKPAIVFINSVQAIGNTEGMEALDYYAFIEATGQFIVEDGVRKFNVETWNQDVQSTYAFGGLRREGDQVIIINQDGSNTEYELVDPPDDLPSEVKFPESQITVNGAVVDGKLYWVIINYYPDSSSMGGGGGGGGGMGFYQLNLSGTPIPFPTATAPEPGATTYTTAELASFLKYTVKNGDTAGSIAASYGVSLSELGRVNNLSSDYVIATGWVLTIPGVPGPTRLDGDEGTLQVQIFEKPDGRLREAYTFTSKKDQVYYQVKGENLKPLQDVANRPIKIWGTINYDETGSTWLTLEKFEVVYPDLQFEVLRGTQQTELINNIPTVLFTTNGITYVQLVPNGGYPDYSSYDGTAEVNLEVLRVPGETYAGYPAVRVFSSGLTVDPSTGNELQLHRVTEEIEIYPDPYGNEDQYVPPDLTIDRVELIYLTNHPAYRDSNNPDAPVGQGYIQPVWHFQGHYSNGDVVDMLIQALNEEYLSPELSQNPGQG